MNASSNVLLVAAVALVALAVPATAGAGRTLLQSYNAGLQIPASCKAMYTCQGQGNQLYTCNGTAWAGTGSDVKLESCTGGESGTYSYDTSSDATKTPTYKLGCGSVQGDTASQTRVPQNAPTDSTLYRRAALSPSGCLSDIKYIARTAAKGGLPSDASCTQKGGKERIPYSGTWDFLAC